VGVLGGRGERNRILLALVRLGALLPFVRLLFSDLLLLPSFPLLFLPSYPASSRPELPSPPASGLPPSASKRSRLPAPLSFPSAHFSSHPASTGYHQYLLAFFLLLQRGLHLERYFSQSETFYRGKEPSTFPSPLLLLLLHLLHLLRGNPSQLPMPHPPFFLPQISEQRVLGRSPRTGLSTQPSPQFLPFAFPPSLRRAGRGGSYAPLSVERGATKPGRGRDG